MNKELVKYLYKNNIIDNIDFYFADLIYRLSANHDPWVGLAGALVSHAGRQGHVCLDLDDPWLAKPLTGEIGEEMDGWISAEKWSGHLRACRAVGCPGDFTPLILENHRLYLQRNWYYEQVIAQFISAQCRQAIQNRPATALDRIPLDGAMEMDADQQAAARLAVERKFCVISGGPGTGKTYTLARIIRLLETLPSEKSLRIRLAAPTGKAAARLQQAIEANLGKLDTLPDRSSESDTDTAQTLHRLLAIDPRSGRSRFHADKPLAADVVIVDEASMIDLALMAKLVLALPEHARLILSGDKDQLASVEAGAVLGDICHGGSARVDAPNAGTPASDRETQRGLAENIVLLRRNFRFESHSGLHELGAAINRGDSRAALDLLADVQRTGIAFHPVAGQAEVAALLEKELGRVAPSWFEEQDPANRLTQSDGFKILAVVRRGPYGVEQINLWVERVLARMGLIPTGRPGVPCWYHGKPVMVIRNDYYHNLFNGDTGVVLDSAEGGPGEPCVAFRDHRGGVRYLRPHQLPAHLTAYATTVHRSQGSEFDRVVIILPDQDVPVLTRELLYTAVTRARQSVVIMGSRVLFETAVQRPTRRTSGLREKLWS